ncbi:unnamed protein product [Symbiodinium sp. CCMP2592]|nr:unnamed protein product [Symbiodinium sp. CCMP2592]
MNQDFRSFCLLNHGSHCRHFYTSLEAQLACDAPCFLCVEQNAANTCTGHLEGPGVDLLVTGTPCDPFSVQRSKRFADGRVKQHEDFSLTMETAVDMYLKYEPHVGVLEQVKGFIMPLSSGQNATPYDRFMEAMQQANFQHGGYYFVKLQLDADVWLNISRPRLALLAMPTGIFLVLQEDWVAELSEPIRNAEAEAGREDDPGESGETQAADAGDDWSQELERELATASDVQVPSAPKPVGRRAGRPRGSVSLRASLQGHTQPIGVPDLRVADRLAASRAAAAVQRKQRTDEAVAAFGPEHLLVQLGPLVQRTVGAALIASIRKIPERPARNDAGKKTVVQQILDGDVLTCSASTIARLAGRAKNLVQSMLLQAGSAVVESAGLLWNVMASTCVQAAATSSSLKPVMMCVSLRYDETPTKVRVTSLSTDVMSNEQGQLVLVPRSAATTPALLSRFLEHLKLAPAARSTQQTATHAKVLQTQLDVGMLFARDHAGEKRFAWVVTTVPTVLQAMQRSTGEVQLACVLESFGTLGSLAELNRVSSAFPCRVKATTTDRYSANYRTEEGLRAHFGSFQFVHLLCDCHRCSSAIGNSLKSVQSDMSGAINTALALSDLGSVKVLRDMLTAIFFEELTIHHESPPPCEYRAEVFRLFLPVDGGVPLSVQKINRRRRFILQAMLNGPIDAVDRLDHYCQWGCCRDAADTLSLMALYCTWALVPFASCKPPLKMLGSATMVLLGVLLGQKALMSHQQQLSLNLELETSLRKKQKVLAAQGKARSWPVLEAARLVDVTACLRSLLEIMLEPALGARGIVTGHTRALKFLMTSAGMCGVHVYLRLPRQSFPYQLFSLLDDASEAAVQRIKDFPVCLHDEFTSYFIEKGYIGTETGLAMLEAVADILFVDVAGIESGHSSAREFASLRSRGWVPTLETLASRFVLQERQRSLGKTGILGFSSSKRKANRPDRPKRKNPGGGGAWRAFNSHYLCGRKLTAALATEMSRVYRSLSEAEMQKYIEAGRGACLARRQGFPSFPKSVHQRVNRPGMAVHGHEQPGEERLDGAGIVAADIERADFAVVPYAGDTLAERYFDFKLALKEEMRKQQALDPAQLSEEEIQILKDFEHGAGAEPLPAASIWTREMNGQLLSALQASPATRPRMASYSWCPPAEQVAEACVRGTH